MKQPTLHHLALAILLAVTLFGLMIWYAETHWEELNAPSAEYARLYETVRRDLQASCGFRGFELHGEDPLLGPPKVWGFCH